MSTTIIVGIGGLLVVGGFIFMRMVKKYETKPVKFTLFDEEGIVGKTPNVNEAATIDISVVVPAYNEELRLPKMLAETSTFLESFCKSTGLQYEIIVVDDGSRDCTHQITRDLQQSTPCLRALKLARNVGKGGAVRNGVLVARGRHILMADADAATDIHDFASLYTQLKAVQTTLGSDSREWGMAVGSRAHLEKESKATRALHRTILMMGFHALVALLCTKNVHDTQCGFKLFTRAAAGLLFQDLHLERWAFDVEVIFLAERLGIPIVEVAVNWHEVAGSKLIETKWDIITTSLSMAKDMFMVKMCYTLGIWKPPNRKLG